MGADVTLFTPRPGVAWRTDTQLSINVGGNKYFRGENPQPGTAISYYLKAAATGDVKLTISDYSGKVVREFTAPKDAGLNRVQWNLRASPPAGAAGGGQRRRGRWWWRRRRWRRRRDARAGQLPREADRRRQGVHDPGRDRGGRVAANVPIMPA